MRRLATVLATAAALVVTGTPATAGDPDFGRMWARDKVLKRGCHDYGYQWRIRPGSPEWTLETFLRDPTGEMIASDVFDNDTADKRDHDTFRFCRWSTRPGRFKIRGKLTIYEGTEQTAVWVRPGYFRMRVPS